MGRVGFVAMVAVVATIATAGASAQMAPVAAANLAAPVPSARMPLLAPIALGGTVERSTRISSNLRLRMGTTSTSAGPNGHVHQRLASSMVELYPLAGSGFHLSAGGRLYDARAGEQASNRGLMVASRGQLGAGGGRVGLRRAPALTLGYTGTLASDTSVGLEVGAMQGRAYEVGGRLTRPVRGDRDGVGNPLNPVVNLVIGRRF